MPKRLYYRAGNRGVALGTLGVLWLLTAIGTGVAPLKRRELLDEHFIPIWARVALWGLPGLLAVTAAFWKKFDADAWGWLMVPVIVRFISYLVGWIASIVGWEAYSYPDGWRGCTSIAIFVVFIRACAAGLDRAPATHREA